MFGIRFKSERNKAKGGEERLSGLLKAWKGPEPKANFEAAVWRRIRAAAAPTPQGLNVVMIVREWLVARPAWVSATAAAAGIIVGVGLAFSTPAVRDGRQADEPLLHSQTLAGSYLTMVTGGAR